MNTKPLTVWAVFPDSAPEDRHPIAIYRTEARAQWHAKRFGVVEEISLDKVYRVTRYNGAVQYFFLDENQALEAATNPNYKEAGDLDEITTTAQLVDAHRHCQQYEQDVRAEAAYERKFG